MPSWLGSEIPTLATLLAFVASVRIFESAVGREKFTNGSSVQAMRMECRCHTPLETLISMFLVTL